MFLGDQSQQDLSDPQVLNAYSYSEDNPITQSDPTGKLVQLVAVRAGGTLVGIHEYVLITNTPQAAAQLTGVPAGVSDPTRITLSGEPSQSGFLGIPSELGYLVPEVNMGPDYTDDEKKAFKITPIDTPAKYNGNETAFEDSILNTYDSLPSEVGPYDAFAGGLTGGQNSNNFANYLLTNSGVDNNMVNNSAPFLQATPGIGTPLHISSAPSIQDRLQNILNGLQNLYNELRGTSTQLPAEAPTA